MKASLFTPPIHPTAVSLAGPLYHEARRRGFSHDRVHAATVLASHAHAPQRRLDGSAFFGHPAQVALVCSFWNCSEDTFLAAELHDVVEDAPQYKDAVEEVFGPNVMRLIDVLTKDTSIKNRTERVAEAQGRLIASLDQFDLNPIYVKLADRAHNLASSALLTTEKLARLEAETIEFFVPLAIKVECKGLANWMCRGAKNWQACEKNFLNTMCLLGPAAHAAPPCGL